MTTEIFTFTQMREILKMQEETIFKVVNDHVKRLESKIDMLMTENILLSKKNDELEKSQEFLNKKFEEKIINDRPDWGFQERLTERCNYMDNRIDELEDRNRRNNIRIDGLVENENENWEETEEKVQKIIKEDLGIEEEVIIERAHRTGRKMNNRSKRTVVAKLLNYKQKMKIMDTYKAKELWNQKLFINDDFSERTMEIRKELFRKANYERKVNGKFSKVVYKTLIVNDRRPAEARQEKD